HLFGGAVMSASPRDGFCDESGRARGADGLYVTDASSLPTNTGVNPQVTIQANALRIAAGIAAERGAPPRPTRALARGSPHLAPTWPFGRRPSTVAFRMEDRPRLSVVLPAYNEVARIATCIDRARAYLDAQGYASELIVVSDGSTDGTARVAREVGGTRVRVIETTPNRGKGSAVRAGMLAAEGAHVLFSDVDLSTPIAEVARFLACHGAGADVVVGSRALDASDVQVRQAWWRESMGRAFNRVARRIAGVDMPDTQCGFKTFRRDAARAIFERTRIDGYAFDVEV